MNIFGFGTDEADNDPEPETEYVTVTDEVEYTEHRALATFVDGTEQQYTFDAVVREDGALVLKSYTGAYAEYLGPVGESVNFAKETVVTIPYANLKDFETVERITKTMEYEREVEREVEGE